MSSDTPQFGVAVLLVVAAFFFALGTGGGIAIAPVVQEPAPSETASVSCTPFQTAQGNASAVCFTHGDVDFRWLDDEQAANYSTNGTVDLSGLPEDNSTVRRPGDE